MEYTSIKDRLNRANKKSKLQIFAAVRRLFCHCTSIVQSLLLCAIYLLSTTVCAQEVKTLYFFSPEVTTTRNTILKGTFDKYLLARGDFQFQPVEKPQVFEKLLLSGQIAAFILSPNHYKQLLAQNKNLSSLYTPALQGERNGSDSYYKLLVSKSSELHLNQKVIASARGERLSLNLIRDMFPSVSEQTLSSVQVLQVPKDIDALMSVGFGLADMSLSTDDSFSILTAMHQGQGESLTVLGKSHPLKRMIVILPRTKGSGYQGLGTLLQGMPDDTQGKRALKLIGLDSWRKLKQEVLTQGGEQ